MCVKNYTPKWLPHYKIDESSSTIKSITSSSTKQGIEEWETDIIKTVFNDSIYPASFSIRLIGLVTCERLIWDYFVSSYYISRLLLLYYIHRMEIYKESKLNQYLRAASAAALPFPTVCVCVCVSSVCKWWKIFPTVCVCVYIAADFLYVISRLVDGRGRWSGWWNDRYETVY